MELVVHATRAVEEPETGIFVRAKDSAGRWGSHDIAHLTKESLLVWLRSRGGSSSWAEDVVAILLGHGPFTVNDESKP